MSLCSCSKTLRAVALLAMLAPAAFANTYIVDDSGGPGVDFTEITSAIAAAQAGDVLLVRNGSYGEFTLAKGLSILGAPGVTAQFIRVDAIPAGEVAVLTNITLPNWSHVRVTGCLGTVIVQHVESQFDVIGSTDVRFHEVSAKATYLNLYNPFVGASLLARRSRVEVVQSTLVGANGVGNMFKIPGDRGGPAVYAAGPGLDTGALLHLALSSCTGGPGGPGNAGGGQGGAAVLVGWEPAEGWPDELGCNVVIAGGGEAILRGGRGAPGLWDPNALTGPGGTAIVVHDPRVRFSGVELIPGEGDSGPGVAIEAADPSFVSTPAIADPTLGVSGDATPGSTLLLRLRSEPNSKGILRLGFHPIVEADALAQIETLVEVTREWRLGAVPPSGAIEHAFQIPSTATAGTIYYLQAAVILPGGEYRRTNSIPIVVH